MKETIRDRGTDFDAGWWKLPGHRQQFRLTWHANSRKLLLHEAGGDGFVINLGQYDEAEARHRLVGWSLWEADELAIRFPGLAKYLAKKGAAR